MSLNMFKHSIFVQTILSASATNTTNSGNMTANQTAPDRAALQTAWHMFQIGRSWTAPDGEVTSVCLPTCGSCEEIQIKIHYSFSSTCRCLLLSIVPVYKSFTEKSFISAQPAETFQLEQSWLEGQQLPRCLLTNAKGTEYCYANMCSFLLLSCSILDISV